MRNSTTQFAGVLFAGAILVAGALGASYYMANVNASTETVTITRDAEVVIRGSGENTSQAREVYTDAGVFVNQDSMWHGKWNSSDLHSMFVRGATCTIDTVGFRIPFLSMHKNIVAAECEAPAYVVAQ